MSNSLLSTVISILGFVVGGLIGLAFGAIQQAAKRRNEKRQANGKFSNAWFAMPGSMTRVAFLMIALVLVQIGCPLLFEGNIQWLVSAGVVLGYGSLLFKEFRNRTVATHG